MLYHGLLAYRTLCRALYKPIYPLGEKMYPSGPKRSLYIKNKIGNLLDNVSYARVLWNTFFLQWDILCYFWRDSVDMLDHHFVIFAHFVIIFHFVIFPIRHSPLRKGPPPTSLTSHFVTAHFIILPLRKGDFVDPQLRIFPTSQQPAS